MDSYFETDSNGNKFFVYVDNKGNKNYCITNDDDEIYDEYDGCRCGNIEDYYKE